MLPGRRNGFKKYLTAVEDSFGIDVDFAMLTKVYGKDISDETRYNPTTVAQWSGRTLTMRMHMRRFTRVTVAFSKKLENHMAAVALHSVEKPRS